MVTSSIGHQLEAHLRSTGIVTDDGIARAASAATTTGTRLDHALVELGLIREQQLLEIACSALGVKGYQNEEVLAQLPKGFASYKHVLLLVKDDASTLGMTDPYDDETLRSCSLFLGARLERTLLTAAMFGTLFASAYGDIDDHIDNSLSAVVLDNDTLEGLRETDSQAPAIRLIKELCIAASERRASDIHLRAAYPEASIHLRVDGALFLYKAVPRDLFGEVVSRLKLLAKLDIAERRLPQDGRLRLSVAGRQTDFRISTMPHLEGEGLVLRLLSRDAAELRLDTIGLDTQIVAKLKDLSNLQSGLFLVVGPTGSGKTTTLYALLNALMRPTLNIVTVEDPVEYRLAGLTQIQVDERVGFTFARALRSILRQDPDVILVGEIRDPETAQIAVQAALTGHLVLATLHADKASDVWPRLVDMGIEPYLLAAVLKGAMSQHLVPIRCTACSDRRSAECPECRGTGIGGRRPVAEFQQFDGEASATAWRHVTSIRTIADHEPIS
jgi:general secretion pathway protein E